MADIIRPLSTIDIEFTSMERLKEEFRANARKGPEMDMELHLAQILKLDQQSVWEQDLNLRNRLISGARHPMYLRGVFLRTDDAVAVLKDNNFDQLQKDAALQELRDLKKVAEICQLDQTPQFSEDELDKENVQVIQQTWAENWPVIQAFFDKYIPTTPGVETVDRETRLIQEEALRLTQAVAKEKGISEQDAFDLIAQTDRYKKLCSVLLQIRQSWQANLYYTPELTAELKEDTNQELIQQRELKAYLDYECLSYPQHIHDFMEKQPEMFEKLFAVDPKLKAAFAKFQQRRSAYQEHQEDHQAKYNYDDAINDLLNLINQKAGMADDAYQELSDKDNIRNQARQVYANLLYSDEEPTMEEFFIAYSAKNQAELEAIKFSNALGQKTADLFDKLADQAGLIILRVDSSAFGDSKSDRVLYIEQSPQAERKLPPKAITQLKGLLDQLRENPEDNNLIQQINDIIWLNLPSEDKALDQKAVARLFVPTLYIASLVRYGPEQMDLLQRMFEQASPELQQAFNNFKAAPSSSDWDNHYQALTALNDLIDQSAGITPEAKEELEKEESDKVLALSTYDALFKKPALDKISAGDVIEAAAEVLLTRDAVLITGEPIKRQRNNFLSSLASKAGLKLIPDRYLGLLLAEKDWRDQAREKVKEKIWPRK